MSNLKPMCLACRGSGWLCEEHPTMTWEHDDCDGAGVPCACNPQATVAFKQVFVEFDTLDEL